MSNEVKAMRERVKAMREVAEWACIPYYETILTIEGGKVELWDGKFDWYAIRGVEEWMRDFWKWNGEGVDLTGVNNPLEDSEFYAAHNRYAEAVNTLVRNKARNYRSVEVELSYEDKELLGEYIRQYEYVVAAALREKGITDGNTDEVLDKAIEETEEWMCIPESANFRVDEESGSYTLWHHEFANNGKDIDRYSEDDNIREIVACMIKFATTNDDSNWMQGLAEDEEFLAMFGEGGEWDMESEAAERLNSYVHCYISLAHVSLADAGVEKYEF